MVGSKKCWNQWFFLVFFWWEFGGLKRLWIHLAQQPVGIPRSQSPSALLKRPWNLATDLARWSQLKKKTSPEWLVATPELRAMKQSRQFSPADASGSVLEVAVGQPGPSWGWTKPLKVIFDYNVGRGDQKWTCWMVMDFQCHILRYGFLYVFIWVLQIQEPHGAQPWMFHHQGRNHHGPHCHPMRVNHLNQRWQEVSSWSMTVSATATGQGSHSSSALEENRAHEARFGQEMQEGIETSMWGWWHAEPRSSNWGCSMLFGWFPLGHLAKTQMCAKVVKGFPEMSHHKVCKWNANDEEVGPRCWNLSTWSHPRWVPVASLISWMLARHGWKSFSVEVWLQILGIVILELTHEKWINIPAATSIQSLQKSLYMPKHLIHWPGSEICGRGLEWGLDVKRKFTDLPSPMLPMLVLP